MRRPFRISSEAECPAARARFSARTSSSCRRTVVDMSRAIYSPYIEAPGRVISSRRSLRAQAPVPRRHWTIAHARLHRVVE